MRHYDRRHLGRAPLPAVLLVLAGSAVLAGRATAQTIVHVPGDQPNLTAAITSVPDGGVIEMAAGNYPTPAIGFAINGLPKAFTIRAAAGSTVVLDGASANNVVRFQNLPGQGRPVTFENLIFRNGRSATPGAAGGVTMQQAKATFRGCRFENNVSATTTGGGGIEIASSSEAYFVDCVFLNNSASQSGGAIELQDGSRAWIHRSQFIGNRTNLPNHNTFAAGGAIHVGNSILRVSNSRFDSNQAGYVGGAIYAIGDFVSPFTTPHSDVILSNCTFVNNKAAHDPSVTPPAPTEGGAVHFENQTTARIFNSRFDTNSADTGGAVNLYRAIVTVKGCAFRGNRAVGLGPSTGFGGAMSAISNDGTTMRTATLTVSDTVIQGRFGAVTTVGQMGGGIFVGGDVQSGVLPANRATLNLTNVAFYDCEVVSNPANLAAGGALTTNLAAITASDVLFAKAAAGGSGNGSGGAMAILGQSSLSLTNSTVAASSAGQFGGGLFATGSQVAISGSSIVENTSPLGAGIFSGPDATFPATGTVTSTKFSDNTGVSIFDDDRTLGPINAIQYNGNTIFATTPTQAYQEGIITGTKTVAQLNGLTVIRTSPVPSTVKVPSPPVNPNTAPSSAPIVGLLKAVPPLVLAQGAAGDPPGPTTSYLVYGWSGGAALLNGSAESGFAGLTPAVGPGSDSLTVGSSPFSDSVLAGASPSGSLLASPNPISPGGNSLLSWTSPAGTFLDSAVDQEIGFVSTTSGSRTVTPPQTKTYTFFQISEEGGAAAPATVTVQVTPPLGTPTVTSPTNNSTLTTSTQTLAWTAVSGTVSYEVLLTDVTAGKTELHITVPAPGLSTIYSLHSSHYQLKVRACQTVCGTYSTVVTFTVALPAVPTAAPGISNSNCTVSGGNSLTCNWNAVARADLYQFYVIQPNTGPGGGALTVAARVVSATTVTLPVPSGVANVIVAGCNGDGCGPFSTPVPINPAGPNPTAPSLGTPLGGSIVSGPAVVFSWNRIPGDNGSNTIYRLFVNDLSRQATALDVFTTQNFWSAVFMAEGSRYDGLVIANPGPSQVQGPAQGFNVSGVSASAPTMVSPAYGSSVKAPNVPVGWTPVPGAGLYQYYLQTQVGGVVVTGVTSALTAQATLGTLGGYNGIARACPSGMSCTAGSDVGWGPWSNAVGGPGVTNFTVTP